MSIERISADGAPAPTGPYSHASTAAGFVFISGTLGRSREDGSVPEDFRDEAALALANLVEVLRAAGADPHHVVRTMCLLTDADHAEVFDEEYGRVFAQKPPARSTFVVGLPGGARVEIEATAYVG